MSSIATLPPVPTGSTPLRFFLIGATGRTAIPFLKQALTRGHVVTAYARNTTKLPTEFHSHPNLHIVQGTTADTESMMRAVQLAQPDVVFAMLASDPKPHDGVSSGTHSIIVALRTLRQAAKYEAPLRPIPFISIAGWGTGPSRYMLHRWIDRVMMSAARYLYAAPIADFEKQRLDLEAAHAEGLLQPIVLLPPLLTDGPRTDKAQYGKAEDMQHVMTSTNTISREDLAYACLTLGEKAAAGETISQWQAIRTT